MATHGTQVVVKVKDVEKVYPELWIHSHYITQEDDYFVFDIPANYWGDVVKFQKGQYSKLSNDAKDMIRLNSGLDYRVDRVVKGKTQTNTDARIRALSRDQELIDFLERELAITIGKDDELISPPSSDEVWVDKRRLDA